ncbi:hypothetical protein PAEPH01_2904, partial [Pancytospora epiphaga]
MAVVHMSEKSLKEPSSITHCHSSQDDEILTSADINKRFTKAISAIGYNEIQQERIVKSFTIEKKIKTIVALQKVEEKKRNIGFYMKQLRTHDSIVGLLFLRMSLEPKGKNGGKPDETEVFLYRYFIEEEGVLLIDKLFLSYEEGFLENLMKFVLLLIDVYNLKVDILRKVLLRYSKISKNLFFIFINKIEDLSMLVNFIADGSISQGSIAHGSI